MRDLAFLQRSVCALFLTAALAGSSAGQEAGGDVYEAPSREPTPDETLILEYMNRFRSDPHAEADIILSRIKKGPGVDWKMFEKEMKQLKPSPPLVFNLGLLDSARKHSWYMIHNGLTHDEIPGRKGFTGRSPGDRMKAAGYEGFGSGENAYAASLGAWHSHWGYIVDSGPGGSGGMQPGRGHRMNMVSPRYREVGPGGVPYGKGRMSVTHNFGTRNDRLAGGVMYIDLNGNEFYDVGEGVGQVAIIASDRTATVSWSSGAYALKLKGRKTVTLTASIGGEKFSTRFPSGAENVKFDWIIPVEIPLARADKLLGALEKVKDPASKEYRRALITLYVHTRGLYMDPPRKTRVEELTKEVGAELEARKKDVRGAIRNPETPGLAKLLSEGRKDYRGTAAEAWFQDAAVVAKLRKGIDGFRARAKVKRPTPGQVRQMRALIERTAARMKTVDFRQQAEALARRVQ